MDKYSRGKIQTIVKAFDNAAKEYSRKYSEEDDDRQNIIWYSRINDIKNTFSVYMNETGNVLEQIAESEIHLTSISTKIRRRIKAYLENEDVDCKEPMWIESNELKGRLCIALRTKKPGITTASTISDILSVACNMRLITDAKNPFYLSSEFHEFLFNREPTYRYYTGCAGAIRENEKISGDNYLVTEPETGRVIVGLSDGMGSGNTASKDSEFVLEEIDKLCQYGYTKEAAVRIVSGLILSSGERNPATIDLCEINLYSGEYSLIKAGAAATYVVNGDEVFCMKSGTLPIGIDYPSNMETGRGSYLDHTYIVMLTDGVGEAINTDDEDNIEEMLRSLRLEQPSEIAGYLLNRAIISCGGHINDDMMVLVTGLWKNE